MEASNWEKMAARLTNEAEEKGKNFPPLVLLRPRQHSLWLLSSGRLPASRRDTKGSLDRPRRRLALT